MTGVVLNPVDLKALRETLGAFSDKRFNGTLAMALTATVGAVKDAEVREMKDVFDRPTPWTMGSMYVEGAKADKLIAETGIKDNPFAGRSPSYYLRWEIYGGSRSLKAFEKRLISAGAMPDDYRAVPGMFARLDNFGNMSKGQLNQIFSQLRIEQAAGAKSTLVRISKTDDSPKVQKLKQTKINAAYRKAGGQYIAFPNGRGKLLPGIYQVRSFQKFGRTDPKPVLIFVRWADYEAIFDYDYVAMKTVEREFQPQVNQAITTMADYWYKKYGGR